MRISFSNLGLGAINPFLSNQCQASINAKSISSRFEGYFSSMFGLRNNVSSDIIDEGCILSPLFKESKRCLARSFKSRFNKSVASWNGSNRCGEFRMIYLLSNPHLLKFRHKGGVGRCACLVAFITNQTTSKLTCRPLHRLIQATFNILNCEHTSE